MNGVSQDASARTLGTIKKLMEEDPDGTIRLVITSAGGRTGVALGFYDLVRDMLKAPLETVGSGDVDSAGIILFMAGRKRFLTKNTTMLLHLAGRTFDGSKRFSTAEMESMLREDKLKDFQYASVVAENSGGRLSAENVLELMRNETVLTPPEAVRWGIAHGIV
jgi:ATP-dependent protease ClpP protease subunit